MMAANKGKPQRREKGGCNLRRASWKLWTAAHKEVRTERKQEADNEKEGSHSTRRCFRHGRDDVHIGFGLGTDVR